MGGRLTEIVVDCREPAVLAAFWADDHMVAGSAALVADSGQHSGLHGCGRQRPQDRQ